MNLNNFFNKSFIINFIFLSIFFLALFIHSTEAATCTWIGTTNDWHTGSNWSGCGGNPPTSGDDAVFPTTATNKTISIGSTDAFVQKLIFEDTYTINGTASIIFNTSGSLIILQTNTGKTVNINAKVEFQHSSGGRIEVDGSLAAGGIKINNDLSYTQLEVTTSTFAFTRYILIDGVLKKITGGTGNITTPSGEYVSLYLKQADSANNGVIQISGLLWLMGFSSSMSINLPSGSSIRIQDGNNSEVSNYTTNEVSVSFGDGPDVGNENLLVKGNVNITSGTFNYHPNASSQIGKLIIGNSASVSSFSPANFVINTSNGFTPSNSGQALVLVDYQKSGAFPGSFSGYSEGQTFNIGSVTYRITYQGGDGNDVVICPDNSSLYTSTCASVSSTPTPTPTLTPTPTPTPTSIPTPSSVSSSSTGGGSVSAPSCQDEKPTHAPQLFQIHTYKDKAVLYFTPVNSNTNKYFISYGYWPGDERFGVEFDQGYYDGVLSYVINYLNPNTTYYFKVRAGNGCMPGDWGNEMWAKTRSYNSRQPIIYHWFNQKQQSVAN